MFPIPVSGTLLLSLVTRVISTPTCSKSLLQLGYSHTTITKMHVFCIVTVCRWASSSRSFEVPTATHSHPVRNESSPISMWKSHNSRQYPSVCPPDLITAVQTRDPMNTGALTKGSCPGKVSTLYFT